MATNTFVIPGPAKPEPGIRLEAGDSLKDGLRVRDFIAPRSDGKT